MAILDELGEDIRNFNYSIDKMKEHLSNTRAQWVKSSKGKTKFSTWEEWRISCTNALRVTREDRDALETLSKLVKQELEQRANGKQSIAELDRRLRSREEFTDRYMSGYSPDLGDLESILLDSRVILGQVYMNRASKIDRGIVSNCMMVLDEHFKKQMGDSYSDVLFEVRNRVLDSPQPEGEF